MNSLTLEVLTPDSTIFKGEVDEITIPATLGEMCVLPGHATFVSSMKYGVARYQKDATIKKIALHIGFFFVRDDKITILADCGEHADVIDMGRAKKAESAAREKLKNLTPDSHSEKTIKKFEAKLWRAITRTHTQ